MVQQSKPVPASPVSDEQKAHGFGWYLNRLFVLLLFYLLSIGPAYRLTRTARTDRTLQLVYFPLVWGSDRSHTLNDLLEWYVFRVWRAPQL